MRVAEKLDWKGLKIKKGVGNRKIIMLDEVRHRVNILTCEATVRRSIWNYNWLWLFDALLALAATLHREDDLTNGMNGWGILGRFLSVEIYSSALQSVKTGSGAYRLPFKVTAGSFMQVKRNEHKSNHSHPQTMLRRSGARPLLPL
jgi:hypothetical protein